MTNLPKSVCVYCGSRDGGRASYGQAADDTGAMLARRGWRLVYGAGDVGLMGRVANAAQTAGGKTFGVIPTHLLDWEVGKRDLDTFIITETMHERKKVMIMNAEFVGDWHVVARGHPNDGRAESCAWDTDFGLRQRWEARRRIPGNQHVPHPQIETRSFRERTWEFDQTMQVRIDGARAVSARRVEIIVEPDAATIYA